VPAEQAVALAERFAFIYTPTSASWRKMIACECSVVARLGLNRRIAMIEQWSHETLARLAERSTKAIKINWQFAIPAARSKLNSHYTTVHPENEQYKKT
jgi:hypothetical protein